MKKLKVLLVSEYFPPVIFGGGEISAYNLAKSLVKKGFDVSVLTSHFDRLKQNDFKEGIKIYRRLKTGRNPSSFSANLKRVFYFQKSLKKELKKVEQKYDVVHFLNTTSIPNFKVNNKTMATINGYTNFCPKRNLFYKERCACSGCSFGKFLGCIVKSKFIGKSKISIFLKFNPVFWILLYLGYKKSNRSLKNINSFISLSDFISSQLRRNKVKLSQITKIPNIVDIEDPEKQFKINEKGVLISYIGALEKIKGIGMLIKAFNGIDLENAKLLVFGDGSLKNYLRKIANKNVKFYGKVDHKFMPSVYKQSDIIVQPALWPEPLSRVLLEATYFGKPIIATDIGGNSEGVVDGKNGFLVENEDELKEKLNMLIQNKSLRDKMSKKSKNIFGAKFNKDKIIKSIGEFYDR